MNSLARASCWNSSQIRGITGTTGMIIAKQGQDNIVVRHKRYALRDATPPPACIIDQVHIMEAEDRDTDCAGKK